MTYNLGMATIDLQQSLVNRLEALAHGEGVSLEVYLERLADQRLQTSPSQHGLSPEELDRLLDSEATSDSTYQGTYSRAEINREHD